MGEYLLGYRFVKGAEKNQFDVQIIDPPPAGMMVKFVKYFFEYYQEDMFNNITEAYQHLQRCNYPFNFVENVDQQTAEKLIDDLKKLDCRVEIR